MTVAWIAAIAAFEASDAAVPVSNCLGGCRAAREHRRRLGVVGDGGDHGQAEHRRHFAWRCTADPRRRGRRRTAASRAPALASRPPTSARPTAPGSVVRVTSSVRSALRRAAAPGSPTRPSRPASTMTSWPVDSSRPVSSAERLPQIPQGGGLGVRPGAGDERDVSCPRCARDDLRERVVDACSPVSASSIEPAVVLPGAAEVAGEQARPARRVGLDQEHRPGPEQRQAECAWSSPRASRTRR